MKTKLPLKKKIWITSAILAVVLLVVGIFTLSSYAANEKIENTVHDARIAQKSSINASAATSRDEVLKYLKLDAAARFASTIDSCFLDDEMSGFQTNYWVQNCFVRYVTVVPVDFERAEFTQKFANNLNVAATAKCSAEYDDPLKQAKKSSQQITVNYVSITPSVGRSCLPALASNYSLRATAFNRSMSIIREYLNVQNLAMGNYVVLTYEEPYLTNLNVGCGFGLFCPPPFDGPVMGKSSSPTW